MGRYAVIGASKGTGLAITRILESAGDQVRAISRTPPTGGANVEPFAADVTDAASIGRALDDAFDAVFFTVDINGGIGGHALFGSREKIREVTFGGCVNAIRAAARAPVKPGFVLLSVMGVDQSSLVWTMLNIVKTGSKRNILEREQALKASGLPFVIARAPRLTDLAAGMTPVAATPAKHKLAGMSIPRGDLARALVAAARQAPPSTSWDVFSSAEGPVPTWLRAGY